MSDATRDRVVAGLMLVTFAFVLVPDHILLRSAEYDEIKAISDWRMWVGPGYVFVVAMTVGFLGTIVGGFSRIFGWKRSRSILIVAAAGIVLSYPGYDTYTSTYLTAAADNVWAMLMGWLIATPVPESGAVNRFEAKRNSLGIALGVIAAFGLSGWSIYGLRDIPSFESDFSIEIEINGVTVEAESDAELITGRATTVRMDDYIVDLLVISSTNEEAKIGLNVFEDFNGTRGAALNPCVDFEIPIGEIFGAAASCGKSVLVLSGRIDPIGN